MAYLNANIPPIYCKIRTEYLYDMDMDKKGEQDCVIFGMASISGRALLFHVMLPNGAVFYRLPISAFFQKRYDRTEVPDMSVDELQLWNCFSYWPSVHCFDWLAGVEGKFLGKDKKFYHGQYLFTIDWAHPDANILDTDHSEIPHEHKCAHIIALDDGNYAAQPNNRCIWDLPSFTVKDNTPDWKVQTNEWNVEDSGKWKTEDTDNFFYEIEEKK